MAFTNAIVEIDKAGWIVVPKKMRDALHLVAGTRLTLKQEGHSIVLEPEMEQKRGLHFEDGMPIYYTGRPVPVDAVHWVEMAREERMRQVMGDWKPE